ncbi:MAG: cation:proton antiporter [Chitinophagales bacterium]
MSIAIIIIVCTLLLTAYIFDLTSSKTKIPSVILLLILGWSARCLSDFFSVSVPDLSPLLSVFGTIGLILIVLEGSLELELKSDKFAMIKKSFWVSILPLFAMAFLLSFLFSYYGNFNFKDSLTNAIPFCVISSAIAIPSVKLLNAYNKEFVIYESSFSDIIGVTFFNFVALNETFGLHAFGNFFMELAIIAVISFIATIALAFLLTKIEHHTKFAPIILGVILIYAVSKVYHLPGLIFILVFGLFLGNLDELRHVKWIEKLKPAELDLEVHKFKELTTEATFLVRSVFFLLFGYLIKTNELLNTDTMIWSLIIVAGVLTLRALFLKLSKLPLNPLLFIAPRGLISVLLFLSIKKEHSISIVNNSLLIQIIVLTAVIMMLGLMAYRKEEVS